MILCCMKKVIYVLVFFLLQLFLQPVSAENVAKDDVTAPMTKSVIKKFYKKLIRGENLQSLELGPSEVKNILSMKAAITQGYDWDVVCQVIDKAKAYTDGEWMDTIVALSFPNGNTVYHQLTGGQLLESPLAARRELCIYSVIYSNTIYAYCYDKRP